MWWNEEAEMAYWVNRLPRIFVERGKWPLSVRKAQLLVKQFPHAYERSA